MHERLFDSFFMGGFECSTHRRRDGRRLDLTASTGHERLAAFDYGTLRDKGIRTMRDGLRWHLIETSPYSYDWSSFLPLLHASRTAGVQVIWDLCHYGWPDDLDIWSPAFIDRFAAFVREAARVMRSESDDIPFWCPVNEISFWAWAGGHAGYFSPCAMGRGSELKRQLVRAALVGIAVARDVDPRARILFAEPLIHIRSPKDDEASIADAESYRLAQFEAMEMIRGHLNPELGGHPDALDIVGLNFYPHNQWYAGGGTMGFGTHVYRPLQDLLAEAYRRFGRPMIIAETGAEGSARAAWLHYVTDETRAARAAGIDVQGICIYPITEYPGWDNDRLCTTGLLSAPRDGDRRDIDPGTANEIYRQQLLMAADEAVAAEEPPPADEDEISPERLPGPARPNSLFSPARQQSINLPNRFVL